MEELRRTLRILRQVAWEDTIIGEAFNSPPDPCVTITVPAVGIQGTLNGQDEAKEALNLRTSFRLGSDAFSPRGSCNRSARTQHWLNDQTVVPMSPLVCRLPVLRHLAGGFMPLEASGFPTCLSHHVSIPPKRPVLAPSRPPESRPGLGA